MLVHRVRMVRRIVVAHRHHRPADVLVLRSPCIPDHGPSANDKDPNAKEYQLRLQYRDDRGTPPGKFQEVIMDHLQRTRDEFARQAESFSASPVITDQAQVERLVTAIGDAARGRVLDVACGPGIVTVALAAVAREVVAFDLTPAMLIKAQERCAKAGRTNVLFREGSATALPFADASFDVVVTRLSLHHFDAPQTVLSEMQRILKQGGTLAVADVVSAEDPDDRAAECNRDAARSVPRAHAARLRVDRPHERRRPLSRGRDGTSRAGIRRMGSIVANPSAWLRSGPLCRRWRSRSGRRNGSRGATAQLTFPGSSVVARKDLR